MLRTGIREDRFTRTAVGEDAAEISDLLGQAYQDEPRMVALLPDPEHRRTKLSELFSLLLDQDSRHRESELSVRGGRIEAVAVWDRPTGVPDRLGYRLVQLPALLSVFRWRIPETMRALETLNTETGHRPDEPHWRLFALGTTPSARGRGLAGELLERGLSRADAQDVPVYTEAAPHAAVASFQRRGFRIIQEYTVPSGLTVFGLWRDPA